MSIIGNDDDDDDPLKVFVLHFQTVKRNQEQYELPLKIVSYKVCFHLFIPSLSSHL